MLRNLAPFFILALALLVVASIVLGPDSYSNLRHNKGILDEQHDKNQQLSEHVKQLRVDVWGMQHDARTLEKTARNQQGLARADELVYIFDKKSR